MERGMLVAALAVMLAFASVFAGALAVSSSLRRRRSAMATQGEGLSIVGLIAWRVRSGYTFATPMARALLRKSRVREFSEEAVMLLERNGWDSSPESVLSVLIVCIAFVAILVAVFLGNVIGAVACALCVVAVAVTLVANERDKRNEEIREAVPDALESMSACFGSGFTLLQTFKQVAAEVPGSLGATFSRCAHILEVGGSSQEALTELKRGAYASELAFVAVALDVQHQSGGTVRQVLSAAGDAVKGALALRRSLRVQTAQAKLSARVVAIMPFILVAVFSLVSPGFLMPFFSSALGYALLALAVLMQACGIALVRRALAVDGVS